MTNFQEYKILRNRANESVMQLLERNQIILLISAVIDCISIKYSPRVALFVQEKIQYQLHDAKQIGIHLYSTEFAAM